MGAAWFAPPTEDVRRRVLAGTLSVIANGALLLLLILLPHRPHTVERQDALDVVLVTLPSEPDTRPDTGAEPEPVVPDPAPETVPSVAAPSATTAPRAETLPSPNAPPDEEEREEDVQGGGAPLWPAEIIGEVMPLPRGSGPGSTEYAVREMFCLSTSDANRNALRCPPSDGSEGLPMLQYASPENIARAEAAFAGLSGDQIRALFSGRGLPVRDLAGQPTLADPSARPTSSADQMRDTLPALHPDPAFGD